MGNYGCITEAFDCAKAFTMLIPFTATYLWESGISTPLSIKTKQRNCFNAEADMRLALTRIEPQVEKLIMKIQEEKSH